MKILIVDDERPFAEAVGEYLTERGLEVRVRHNCFEAVRAAASFRPDVILADLRLPCTSGLDLIRILREAGHLCPIVLMSAYGSGADLACARRMEVSAFLPKPCPLEKIQEAIESALHLPPRLHTATG